jgi:hypothetical protein
MSLIAVLPALAAVLPVAGATASRTVTASVTCTDNGRGGQPEVAVKVTNHTGAPLIVGYVHGFTTPQALVVRMTMVDPGKNSLNTVPNNGSRTLRAPWDDLRRDPGDVGGALVVTNLGPLTPTCGGNGDATLTLGPAPATADAAKTEAATIAAKTLGQLEAWRAYPALYALLHPDVRARVSFRAVACWYADQYGTVDAPPARGVLSTDVTNVSFGAWSWGVTGKQYSDAAAVTTHQQVGTVASSQPVTSTEHLVDADGLWRWFFGTTAAGIAAQDTGCNLGSGSTQPVSGNGSITITTYTCSAGSTVASLNLADCSLDPAAARWTLTGSPLSQPLTWDQTTQIHGPGYSWTGLAFGDYIITPDALPDGVTDYAVRGSANAARQDAGVAVTLGAGEPNVMLEIYLLPGGSASQGGTGSIEVDFYDCQPGMTVATFDASACSPMPPGFDFTLTPGPDVDPHALPGGPIFKVTDGTNLGNGAFVVAGLPFGTYDVGPGNNDTGLLYYAPDYRAIDTSGPGASTYAVSIDAGTPNAVIAVYRFARGISGGG